MGILECMSCAHAACSGRPEASACAETACMTLTEVSWNMQQLCWENHAVARGQGQPS